MSLFLVIVKKTNWDLDVLHQGLFYVFNLTLILKKKYLDIFVLDIPYSPY